MPRRKPASAKQKKAQLQEKRAIKRGDISPPPPPSKAEQRQRRPRRPNTAESSAQAARSVAVVDSARRLQSAFVKLPKAFLDETRQLAADLPLDRPIASESAVWDDIPPLPASTADNNADRAQQLTCPKRPKWRYEMSKKEVEKNEEGLFKKWIDQTDALISAWHDVNTDTTSSDGANLPERMPSAPTSFERNLEVWRQLWRVTEISQILLILLDSRCPLLHYPPSLAAYLSSPYLARKRTILVLTKVDIAGPTRVDAWTRYLAARYSHLPVVPVESYAERSGGEGAGKRKVYEPFIPSAFRQTFVDALRQAHDSLLEPPVQIKDVPEKLKAWRPPVRRDVDWERVVKAKGGQVGTVVGGAAVPRPNLSAAAADENEDTEPSDQPDRPEDDAEPEFLTIGLIGQPNVGKSSLLNALFGTSKVRASRTPGKTKHFQTLFWTPDVRLVDCPGLVMPNFVPMETQVLSGILPISRVSAIPLCIYHAAQLLPLESIFELRHPSLDDAASAVASDKRTWRTPHPGGLQSKNKEQWTAMDILTAFALQKGWVTAKAGRPDVNRAGNAILRSLAEGRIQWAFWPPDTPAETIVAYTGDGRGIWIPHSVDESQDFDADSEDEVARDDEDDSDGTISPEDVEDEDSDVEQHTNVTGTWSKFSALTIDDAGDEDENEDDDDGGRGETENDESGDSDH